MSIFELEIASTAPEVVFQNHPSLKYNAHPGLAELSRTNWIVILSALLGDSIWLVHVKIQCESTGRCPQKQKDRRQAYLSFYKPKSMKKELNFSKKDAKN